MSGSGPSGGGLIQGLDTITAAMESNIIPDQEYLLQGSILDNHVEVLTHRLRGLCDNVMAVQGQGGTAIESLGAEKFAEREMVFSIRSAGSAQPLSLRVRKQNTEPPTKDNTNNVFGMSKGMTGGVSNPWQLRYLGQPEIGAKTLVRSCYDIACSENAVEFLTQLGFRLEFEFANKGLIFRKGRMKITVSKVYKIIGGVGVPGQPPPPPNAQPNGPNEVLDPLSGSHLVELSVLAPSGSDKVAEDMKNFAEQLKPLVVLDKIDPRRQGM